MSRAGSKERSPFESFTSPMKYTLSKSALHIANLGIKVSAGSSSPLQINTLPLGALVPSGHIPPLDTIAARFMLIVVLPVPGAPPKICIFPAANHQAQIHSVAVIGISEAFLRLTVAGSLGV